MLHRSRFAAFVTLGLIACSHDQAPEQPAEVNAASTASFETDRASFGLDLLRAVGKADENVILSPHSVSTVMTMGWAGARGETADEMQRTLRLSGNGVHERIRDVTTELAARNQEGIELRTANAMWAQAGVAFEPTFVDLMSQDYGAAFQRTDFINAAPEAVKTMNAWIDTSTNHKIPTLFDDRSVTEDTRLVLANAVYLKASWKQAFVEAEPVAFAGQKEDVAMMKTRRDFAYRQGDGFEAIAIPYEGDKLEMVALVPDGDLGAFEASLTGAKLLEIFAQLEAKDITLAFPRWHFEGAYALNEPLMKMGMSTAFNRFTADFTGMGSRKALGNLHITDVLQKTYVDVDLEGTEAAAVTATVYGCSSGTPQADLSKHVTVDRPFVVAIVDRPTKTLLFLGHVVKPGPYVAPAPAPAWPRENASSSGQPGNGGCG